MRCLLSCLILSLCLAVLPGLGTALANEQEKLEPWQERLLKALEKVQKEGDGEQRRQGYSPGARQDTGAADAAARAQARHGGQVLAVVRVGDGYRVRLLLKDGRVMTAVVRD